MVARTNDASSPHIRINPVNGSARQFVHKGMLAIVTSAEPCTEFNQAGSRLIGTMLDQNASRFSVGRALIQASRETGLPVLTQKPKPSLEIAA